MIKVKCLDKANLIFRFDESYKVPASYMENYGYKLQKAIDENVFVEGSINRGPYSKQDIMTHYKQIERKIELEDYSFSDIIFLGDRIYVVTSITDYSNNYIIGDLLLNAPTIQFREKLLDIFVKIFYGDREWKMEEYDNDTTNAV